MALSQKRSIIEKLNVARRHNEGVIITYISAGKDKEHTFLLFPKKIIEKGGYTYVQGWSAYQPMRILLLRGCSRLLGQIRQFRIDRILSVEPKPVRDRTVTGYFKSKLQRKGIIGGIWGIFLDLLLVGFAIAMIYLCFVRLFHPE